MAGVDIRFTFPDWAGKVAAHEAELRLLQAALIQTNRGMLFDAEGAYNNHDKWAPLKFRNGQILSRRGKLRKSIAPYNPRGQAGPDGIVRFAGDMIVVGTRLLYASMMNDGTAKLPGGVLKPKNAKALRIPLPEGESANETTRAIRGKPVNEALNRAQEKLQKTRARAAKTRAKFEAGGDDRALGAAVSSDRALANAHERVAKLSARASRIANKGRGGRDAIFVASVKIPARPFDEWNVSDQWEMSATLLAKIVEVMNG